MRHYPGLGVGHTHVNMSKTTDSRKTNLQNFESDMGEANSTEPEEAGCRYNPPGSESDHFGDSDDCIDDNDDDDGRWGEDEDEICALHEMYDS
jgi:hypothetical protein